MVFWHGRLTGMFWVPLLLMAGLCLAESPEEARVKAAFVYNFTKFVEWPESAFEDSSSPFRLCLSGTSAREFAALKGYQAQGRPIEVVALDQIESQPEPDSECHLHYQAGENSVVAATAAREAAPVLTVTDNADDPRMITLFLQGEHVRFAVDQSALSKAGLRASARLLNLAQRLPGSGP